MDCFVSLQKKIPIKPLRMDVITSFNNVICTKNEGKKYESYQRVLLRRKSANICKKV